MTDNDLYRLVLPDIEPVEALLPRDGQWQAIVAVARTRRRRRHLVTVLSTVTVVAGLGVAAAVVAAGGPHESGPTPALVASPTPTDTTAFPAPLPGLPPDAQAFPMSRALDQTSALAIVIVRDVKEAAVSETQARSTFDSYRARDGVPAANTSSELVQLYSRGPWIGERDTTRDRFHRVGLYWLVWSPVSPAQVLMHPKSTNGPCIYLVPIDATTGHAAEIMESCSKLSSPG